MRKVILRKKKKQQQKFSKVMLKIIKLNNNKLRKAKF